MFPDTKHEFNRVVAAYLECAAWTMPENEDDAAFGDAARETAKTHCRAFLGQAGALVADLDPGQVGHDLWLTRNGHGTGFWDRDLSSIGEDLTRIAKAMGEAYVYESGGELHIE